MSLLLLLLVPGAPLQAHSNVVGARPQTGLRGVLAQQLQIDPLSGGPPCRVHGWEVLQRQGH